jgi:hypothetical protein
MSVKLGCQVPEITNDGGVSLCANHKLNIPPVFSMEVIHSTLLIQAKRKKHKKLSSKSVHYCRAAQIYAEMLGQVCHKEFINNPYTDYQEVTLLIPC